MCSSHPTVSTPGWYAAIYSAELPGIGYAAALKGVPDF